MSELALSTDVISLHSDVDNATRHLIVIHHDRLVCKRGCSGCCVDDLTVFAVEALPIRALHHELLSTGTPHAIGACAFLDDDGACRIYENRPYVCRTQGFPLRWIAEDDLAEDADELNPPLIEMRDICPLNETDVPIESLDVDACWTLGPVEARLALLQVATSAPGAPPERVLLRELFVLRAAEFPVIEG